LVGPGVVELADQPQVTQVNTQLLVGLGDRGGGVVQLRDAELDAGPILIGQQQGVPELGPGAPAAVPGRLRRRQQEVEVVGAAR
jgi:hypothetical protein